MFEFVCDFCVWKLSGGGISRVWKEIPAMCRTLYAEKSFTKNFAQKGIWFFRCTR